MKAAFTNLIQNIKTNPAWLLFVQDFKAAPEIPRKIGFFVVLFIGLSKEKYFTEKEQGFSKFLQLARNPASCRRAEVPRTQSYHMFFPLLGLQPVQHLLFPGPPALWKYQDHPLCYEPQNYIWPSCWAAQNLRPLRTQLMPNLWVLKPWETFPWASWDSLWYKLLKNVKTWMPWNLGNKTDPPDSIN